MLALATIVIVQPTRASAQGTTPEIPYGGQAVAKTECTCSAATLVFISDYRTKATITLLYTPMISKLYLNSNPFGPFLLGSYRSGNQCRTAKKCIVIPTTGEFGFQPGTGTSYVDTWDSLTAATAAAAHRLLPAFFSTEW